MVNLKEEIIIKILNKAIDFIPIEDVKKLRNIIDEELYEFDVCYKSTEIVPVNTMAEKIFLFLASKKLDGLSRNTIESYGRCLSKFSRFVQKDIEKIDAIDVRRFLITYANSGSSNNTMATIISILKSFFSWLQREEIIVKNPMLKIPTTKVEKRLRKALTPEELEMLRFACTDIRDKAMLEFFYSTGCRLDEVQKLNKSDIDWNTDTIFVIGKGNKERRVYINAKAKINIWKYFETRADDNEALFISRKNPHSRLGRRSIEKIFNRLGRESGITKKVYPHLLRHTTATKMIQNGASLMEVQMYLGHDNPATTQIYAELDNDAIKISHKKHLN